MRVDAFFVLLGKGKILLHLRTKISFCVPRRHDTQPDDSET
jgi:hypothetical protein